MMNEGDIEMLGAFLQRLFVILTGTLFLSSVAIAQEFCAEASQDPTYFRKRALQTQNRIAFSNPKDGALDLPIGLCWWHSRLQRSLLYLATVRPLKKGEKPMTQQEINQTLNRLIAESAVVELRGYQSIYEFTQKNQKTIHAKMKSWQALEALNGLKGLKGKPVVSASKMAKLMDQLYQAVEIQNFVAYEMLQYPGLMAHSWLVTHMRPIYNGSAFVGYDLTTIDSNYQISTTTFSYRVGQTHFIGEFGDFTPYLQWQSSAKRYASALLKYCRPKLSKQQYQRFENALLPLIYSSADETSNTPEFLIE